LIQAVLDALYRLLILLLPGSLQRQRLSERLALPQVALPSHEIVVIRHGRVNVVLLVVLVVRRNAPSVVHHRPPTFSRSRATPIQTANHPSAHHKPAPETNSSTATSGPSGLR